MTRTLRTTAFVLILLAGVGPALAQDQKLVGAAQAHAGWKGVEAQRIAREGDMIRIVGTDRMGRQVTIATDCRTLRVACSGMVSGSAR